MGAIFEYKKQGGQSIPVSFVIYGDQSAFKEFGKVLQSGSYASANDAQAGQQPLDPVRWAVGMSRDARANAAKFGNEGGPK